MKEPFNLFFCFRSNFRAITRLETLATQAIIGAVDGGTGTLGSHVAKLILYTSLCLVCISNRNQSRLRKNVLHNATTASAIISYFARKGELLFTNSDQIEADRLCKLSKKEKKSVHYMNI